MEDIEQNAEPMEIVEPKRKEAPASLPFVEKYRPDKLDDVVSQNDIVTTCMNCFPPYFLSEDLCRAQEATTYDFPWTTWNRKNFVRFSFGENAVWYTLPQHDSGGMCYLKFNQY